MIFPSPQEGDAGKANQWGYQLFFVCGGAIESVLHKNNGEHKSAGLPATAIETYAREGIEVISFISVLSLSLGTFLSLCIANKEKEMYKDNKTVKLKIFITSP